MLNLITFRDTKVVYTNLGMSNEELIAIWEGRWEKQD